MAVDLARYIVSLEAQTATYVQELDKANRKLDRFHKDQERALSKIKSAFIGLGVTLAAVFSVRAIINFTKASVEMADQLGETARAAGLNAKTLQELRVAFDELGGIASGETDQGLQRFNRTLGLAINGSRQAQQQFRLLGVAFNDPSLTTGAALETTLKGLGQIENDAQRAAISGQLFSRELGPKLAAALKGGSQAMDEARSRVTGIISDQSVRQAEALDDAFKRMAHTIGGPLKEAAIGTAFAIGKIFGQVEDSPEDVLSQKIKDAKGELELIKKSLLAPFKLSDGVQANQMQRAIQLQQTIAVLEAAAAASVPAAKAAGRTMADAVAEGFDDGFKEISTSFGQLPKELKKFDFTGAINAVSFQEISDVVVKMPDDLRKIPPEINSAIAALATYADGLSKADEKQKDLAESMGRGFRDTLTDVFLGVERSFSDLLKRMAAEMFTSTLFSGLASLFTGSTTSIGKFFGNFFGGHLAEGGPLMPGKWHIAGEHGPEPVWGGGAGAFAMGYAGGSGGPSAVIYQTNHFNGGDSREQAAAIAVNNARLERQVEAKMRHERGRRRF